MKEGWEKTKHSFKVGSCLFLFFIGFTFIMTPEYDKKELTYSTIKLQEKPKFTKNCRGKGGCSYSLEINPKTTKLKLNGIDYKYLKHRLFNKEVKLGDILKLGTMGNKILTLSKNGFEYLQFENAQYHKKKNRLFSRYLFSTGLVLCIIPLFFEKQPKIKWEEDIYFKVGFGWILALGLIASFIILVSTIGINFISGDEFVK